VEVKARETAAFGTAAEAVPFWKQRRLARMAADYLARAGLTARPCRFDVVAIDGIGGPAEVVTVYRHAFDACG
jgi:putative endonuclease